MSAVPLDLADFPDLAAHTDTLRGWANAVAVVELRVIAQLGRPTSTLLASASTVLALSDLDAKHDAWARFTREQAHMMATEYLAAEVSA